ncbi:MAG: c-type cytochrome [Campylobacteraceae bacterium]|nr:c-type cytochrome [Campylobacteraceae bacterium]
MRNKLFLTALCFILVGCGGGSDKRDKEQNIFDNLSTQNVISSTVDTTSNTTEKTNESTEETVQKAEKIVQNISQNTDNITNVADLYNVQNGKKVFKRCVPCHGIKANLSAVGKSQDISKWSKESIASALKGYKDGTYGGPTKATMTSLLRILNEHDITDVSSYISTLGE